MSDDFIKFLHPSTRAWTYIRRSAIEAVWESEHTSNESYIAITSGAKFCVQGDAPSIVKAITEGKNEHQGI